MEKLMTPDQVCDVLQVTKDWLYDQVQARRFPHVRLRNRLLRFREKDVQEYIDGQVMD